jgi:hypothetical protein
MVNTFARPVFTAFARSNADHCDKTCGLSHWSSSSVQLSSTSPLFPQIGDSTEPVFDRRRPYLCRSLRSAVRQCVLLTSPSLLPAESCLPLPAPRGRQLFRRIFCAAKVLQRKKVACHAPRESRPHLAGNFFRRFFAQSSRTRRRDRRLCIPTCDPCLRQRNK